MTRQRLLFRLTLLMSTGFISACQKKEQSTAPFKVALLLPGPVSDAGCNASAADQITEHSRKFRGLTFQK